MSLCDNVANILNHILYSWFCFIGLIATKADLLEFMQLQGQNCVDFSRALEGPSHSLT